MRLKVGWIIIISLWAYLPPIVPALHAADEPPVFVCVDTLYPFLYRDNEGAKGPLYDISLVIFKRLNLQAKIELYSFPLIIRYLQEGTVDGVLMLYKNVDRESFILYPELPLWESSINVYVRRGGEFGFRSVEDLYGKRVGNRTDFFISDAFNKAVKQNRLVLDEAREVVFNLKKLLAGRIDCYIGDSWATEYFIDHLDLGKEIVALSSPIVPNAGLYLAITKTGKRIKDKKGFISDLERVIHDVREDGTLRRIEADYNLEAGLRPDAVIK